MTPASELLWCRQIRRAAEPALVTHKHSDNMHRDTLAALRLLVLALEAHPEDIEALNIYGNIAEHLADVIDDHFDDENEEAE